MKQYESFSARPSTAPLIKQYFPGAEMHPPRIPALLLFAE
jgi:hypothetical protein